MFENGLAWPLYMGFNDDVKYPQNRTASDVKVKSHFQIPFAKTEVYVFSFIPNEIKVRSSKNRSFLKSDNQFLSVWPDTQNPAFFTQKTRCARKYFNVRACRNTIFLAQRINEIRTKLVEGNLKHGKHF